MKKPHIAVLALQGAFIEHARIFSSLGADVFEIRSRSDLDRRCNALILPGGESTVQGKLLREFDLFEPVRQMIINGLPVMATCAGLILLAEKLHGDDTVHFGTLPITVQRNAYGRQTESFHFSGAFAGTPDIPMQFIRAPKITAHAGNVKILSSFDGTPTAIHYGKQLAMTWHPEMTGNTFVHRFFLEQFVK